MKCRDRRALEAIAAVPDPSIDDVMRELRPLIARGEREPRRVVRRFVRDLRSAGLIDVDAVGWVHVTPAGRAVLTRPHLCAGCDSAERRHLVGSAR